jgi:hypothetical protein
MRLGFSDVLSARGVPLFLVKGARPTRWSSLVFPLPMVIGVKSLDSVLLEIVML